MIFRWILLIALSLFALVGCGPLASNREGDAVPADPAAPPQREAVQMTSKPIDPALQSLVDMAKEDLAGRLSISVAEIDLVEAKAMVWPDTSFGCPQPGMIYSEVSTPGHLIQLRSENRPYEYHTDAEQLVVFCGEYAEEYPVKTGDIEDDEPWMR